MTLASKKKKRNHARVRPAPTEQEERSTATTRARASSAGRAHNDPLQASAAVADFATTLHAPEMLKRGGPTARARSAVARGSTAANAAAQAAKQGKGHVAELHVAAHFTADSGVKGQGLRCDVNAIQNHPRADLEVRHGSAAVADVQIGIGGTRYTSDKIRTSDADKIVVSGEALRELRSKGETPPPHVADHLTLGDVTSGPVSARQCEDTANAAILDALGVRQASARPCPIRAGLNAGTRSALFTGFASLGFGIAQGLVSGEPPGEHTIKRALKDAWDAFISSALQTFIMTKKYAATAGAAFESNLLHGLTKAAVWAGAAADFLISLAKELLAWFRGETDFAGLMQRLLARAFEVAGGALVCALALKAFGSLPPLFLMLVTAAAMALGSSIGRQLSDWALGAQAAMTERRFAPVTA